MLLKERDPIHIYNSLTRKKEVFTPIKDSFVGLYVCGPTVYGDPHLGHARGAISFDIVYRTLMYLGYQVRYVRNITDVGHLENEVDDEGEDKISKQARMDHKDPMEIVQRYTVSYHRAMDALNVLRPNIEPTATGHLQEQIQTIQDIISNGMAYEVNGSVYFDVEAYRKKNNYGVLSRKVIDDLVTGTRDITGQDEKRGSHDFALWKKATGTHIMKWRSPWGEGFPGWHLECTAMSTKYLGHCFDIHGGGLDLQFPHHDCEIAQAVGAYGQDPVRYWMHNNMLTIDGKKMSKSLGNFITMDDIFRGTHPLMSRAYRPMTIRFFILQAHYRSTLDFSDEALQAAEKGYRRLMNAWQRLRALDYPAKESVLKKADEDIQAMCCACLKHICDDFNTAQVLGALFELASRINDYDAGNRPLSEISKKTFQCLKETFEHFLADVLGLKDDRQDTHSGRLDAVMQMVITLRNDAREKKDFALSDRIRDDLGKVGIQLKDGQDGVTHYDVDG